jgi:hypothetical protein
MGASLPDEACGSERPSPGMMDHVDIHFEASVTQRSNAADVWMVGNVN